MSADFDSIFSGSFVIKSNFHSSTVGFNNANMLFGYLVLQFDNVCTISVSVVVNAS